ncbi:MAG: dihydrodipicolinate synthase family protein [Acidobacteria bacterium]|nr:dihydrodipicolinate synthase family protein [Acidobacteriota bacterium]
MNVEGILPALMTPVTADGGVDTAATERLVARLYAAGVQGLYVCGQTGEGLQQSVAMRKTAFEAAAGASPRGKQVIAHVGSARVEEAIELARHAAANGACAVSSLPPAGAFSYEEIRGYYTALAAATDVPLVLYFFPEAAPGLRAEQVVELCGLRNVAGVKFTSFELNRIAEMNRAGAFVLNGRDEVLAAGLLMGAAGGIGSFYNLVPELCVEVWEASRRGAWSEARAAQDRINRLIAAVLKFPMISAIKKLLEWSGVPCGGALPPRRALSPLEEAALRAEVAAAGFDPAAFLVRPAA